MDPFINKRRQVIFAGKDENLHPFCITLLRRVSAFLLAAGINVRFYAPNLKGSVKINNADAPVVRVAFSTKV